MKSSTASQAESQNLQPVCRWSLRAEIWSVAALVLVVAGLQYAWLQHSDVQFDTPDFTVHARTALDIWEALLQQDPGHALTRTKYGPAGYLPAVGLFQIFGPDLELLPLAQLLLLPVHALALTALGRRLYGPGAGFLACFFLFTTPLFVRLSRAYLLEIPSQALLLTGLTVLICGKALENRRAAVLFGITLGLTAMTKQEVLVLWLLPLALYVVGVLQAVPTPEARRSRLLHLLLAGAVAALLCLPFLLLVGPQSVLKARLVALTCAMEGPEYHWNLWTWLHFLTFRSLGGGHLLLLLLGLLFQRPASPDRRLVISMLVWGLLLVHLGTAHREYYLLNLMGCAALIATGWAFSNGMPRRTPIFMGLLVLVYGIPPLAGWMIPARPPSTAALHHPSPGHENPEGWRILAPLMADRPKRGREDALRLLQDLQREAPDGFTLYLADDPSKWFWRDYLETLRRYHSIPVHLIVLEPGASPGAPGPVAPKGKTPGPAFFLIPKEHLRPGSERYHVPGFLPRRSDADPPREYRLPSGEDPPPEWFQVIRLDGGEPGPTRMHPGPGSRIPSPPPTPVRITR